MQRGRRRKTEVPTDTQPQFELGDTAEDIERRRGRERRGAREGGENKRRGTERGGKRARKGEKREYEQTQILM